MTPALARGRALDEAWVMINFKSCNWRKAEVGFTIAMNSIANAIDVTHDPCPRKRAHAGRGVGDDEFQELQLAKGRGWVHDRHEF